MCYSKGQRGRIWYPTGSNRGEVSRTWKTWGANNFIRLVAAPQIYLTSKLLPREELDNYYKVISNKSLLPFLLCFPLERLTKKLEVTAVEGNEAPFVPQLRSSFILSGVIRGRDKSSRKKTKLQEHHINTKASSTEENYSALDLRPLRHTCSSNLPFWPSWAPTFHAPFLCGLPPPCEGWSDLHRSSTCSTRC